ncbi:MAG: glycosyltransferase family 4 protein [Holosporales bacterium]|jgi:glycosyltransferase involved in cell wall biosynthesis|nr:glycosyltransferase family 4 protein [Holosporales bacterium]
MPSFFKGKKVLFFVTEELYFRSHRLALAQALHHEGAVVSVATVPAIGAPPMTGIRLLPFPWDRKSLNPWKEGKALTRLIRLLRQENPDYLINVSLKPVLYGAVAALFQKRVRCFNLITGLGYIFTENTIKANGLRDILLLVLRFLLKSTGVIVQNPDDLRIFRFAPHLFLVKGSGVDCAHFTPQLEPEGPCTIIFPARMLWHKGIQEFVTAAQYLKEPFPEARFWLVGRSDPKNPAAVPLETLRRWEQLGNVTWLGEREDMASLYAAAHIVCLPSYREGAPKALLEAAASGRPIVTTDTVGCREIVCHGDNGLLVPPRTVEPLIEALSALIRSPQERLRMGRRGRERAVQEFAQEKICAETLQIIRHFPA